MALVVATVVLWASIAVLPRAAAGAAGVGLAAATAIAIWRRAVPAMHLGIFCTLATIALAGGLPVPWVVPLGAALGVYGLIVARTPGLRESITWLRWGSFDRVVRMWVRATVIVSAAALVLWFELLDPDVRELRAFIPALPVGLLLVGGLLFAVLNAAAEEAAFRGIMMAALDDVFGPGARSIVLQAAAFGVMHIRGFPRGLSGVGLAFIYGLMLGYIRRRAGGMYAPWVAHVVADVVIFAIVLALVR